MKILITGANGQLGKCIRDISNHYPEYNFLFLGRKELDIVNKEAIRVLFDKEEFDYCVNTAAYTNVEKAESEKEKAFLVNEDGVKNLAKQCKKNNTTLIQISTDYVLMEKKEHPTLKKIQRIQLMFMEHLNWKEKRRYKKFVKKHYIIRTSWLYSQYGQNFYNTILRFVNEGKSITVTTEQTGTPTNANDLAEVILNIIASDSKKYGIYN